MKFKELIKELFEKTEWKTIYSASGQAYHHNIFIGTQFFNCSVILKSTNKKWQKYKCYFTNGVVKGDMSISALVYNYPDSKEILKQYNIDYE